MKLLVLQRTPLIEHSLDALKRIPLSEVGKPVDLRALHPADEQEFSHELADHPVILTPKMTSAAEHLLSQRSGCGVLVLSARAHLDAHGMLRGLLRERALDARHVALFGTRNWSQEEYGFVQANRVQAYTMLELSREGLGEMTDAVMSYVRNWTAFHLVLDVDVVDPAFASGLSFPSPGGLTSRELLYVLQRLALIRTLVCVEVVVDAKDDAATALLVAHILAELA